MRASGLRLKRVRLACASGALSTSDVVRIVETLDTRARPNMQKTDPSLTQLGRVSC